MVQDLWGWEGLETFGTSRVFLDDSSSQQS